MKRTLPYTLLAMLVFSVTVTAQTTGAKPRLFGGFPDKITCTESLLAQAFSAKEDQPATFSFSGNFLFGGTVISNQVKYPGMQTIVVKSQVFAEAIFVLTKVISADNTVTYKGRIIQTKYADGYELQKDKEGIYQLVKFETEKILPDCRQ